MLNIPILLGTTRPGNKSQHMAAFVQIQAGKQDNIKTEIVDPATLTLPGDGNDDELKDPRYSKLTAEADGFILIIPEYNHSFSGTLKRMLDSELANYIHKPVALVGVSAGGWGGTRAVEHIVPVVRELGMVVSFADVYTTDSYNRFDESGAMVKDVEMYEKNVADMFEELIWLAETLKHGRDNQPSKHHKD